MLSTNHPFFFREAIICLSTKEDPKLDGIRNLLGNEQIGPRCGFLTYKHCLVLYHLAEKYSFFKRGIYMQLLLTSVGGL